ncbi:hypothetical protein RDWZM_003525, partial [Blomia tropicalis]
IEYKHDLTFNPLNADVHIVRQPQQFATISPVILPYYKKNHQSYPVVNRKSVENEYHRSNAIINPAFLDGSVRPTTFTHTNGNPQLNVHLSTDPDDLIGSMSNQIVLNRLHPSTNFAHLTKNVQSQLARLTPSDTIGHVSQKPQSNYCTLPRTNVDESRLKCNLENQYNSSSTTLINGYLDENLSDHNRSISDIAKQVESVAIVGSKFNQFKFDNDPIIDRIISCHTTGDRYRLSSATATRPDARRTCRSIYVNITLTVTITTTTSSPSSSSSSNGIDSLPIQKKSYNSPINMSNEIGTSRSLVSEYHWPNQSNLHQLVTTLRRKHFSLADQDVPKDGNQTYNMSSSSPMNSFGSARRPAPPPPPPPPHRSRQEVSVTSNVTSSSPSPSSSSGVSDSSSTRSSASCSESCSLNMQPSSLSTSFTSASNESNHYEKGINIMANTQTGNYAGTRSFVAFSPVYMNPRTMDHTDQLNVSHLNYEVPQANNSSVIFNQRNSNSPTYGWVYQEDQSKPQSELDQDLIETSQYHHNTFSTMVNNQIVPISMNGPRIDTNNNSSNSNGQSVYVYNNSAFIGEPRRDTNDSDSENESRIKAKIHDDKSYTLFLDEPIIANREQIELRESGPNDSNDTNHPLVTSKRNFNKRNGILNCCLVTTRWIVCIICIILLCFLLAILGFTMFQRFHYGNADEFAFWHQLFPIDNGNNETRFQTIGNDSLDTTTFQSITLMSTLSTTDRPIVDKTTPPPTTTTTTTISNVLVVVTSKPSTELNNATNHSINTNKNMTTFQSNATELIDTTITKNDDASNKMMETSTINILELSTLSTTTIGENTNSTLNQLDDFKLTPVNIENENKTTESFTLSTLTTTTTKDSILIENETLNPVTIKPSSTSFQENLFETKSNEPIKTENISTTERTINDIVITKNENETFENSTSLPISMQTSQISNIISNGMEIKRESKQMEKEEKNVEQLLATTTTTTTTAKSIPLITIVPIEQSITTSDRLLSNANITFSGEDPMNSTDSTTTVIQLEATTTTEPSTTIGTFSSNNDPYNSTMINDIETTTTKQEINSSTTITTTTTQTINQFVNETINS